ncbi:hypothetical protein T01_10405, partial [Trichinella spiralis]
LSWHLVVPIEIHRKRVDDGVGQTVRRHVTQPFEQSGPFVDHGGRYEQFSQSSDGVGKVGFCGNLQTLLVLFAGTGAAVDQKHAQQLLGKLYDQRQRSTLAPFVEPGGHLDVVSHWTQKSMAK